MTPEEIQWLEQDVGRRIIEKLWSDLDRKFLQGENNETPNGILTLGHRGGRKQ